jgi:hypothetical protein
LLPVVHRHLLPQVLQVSPICGAWRIRWWGWLIPNICGGWVFEKETVVNIRELSVFFLNSKIPSKPKSWKLLDYRCALVEKSNNFLLCGSVATSKWSALPCYIYLQSQKANCVIG